MIVHNCFIIVCTLLLYIFSAVQLINGVKRSKQIYADFATLHAIRILFVLHAYYNVEVRWVYRV